MISPLSRYAHLPWAIVPERLAVMASAGPELSAEAIEALRSGQRQGPARGAQAVALISIVGPMEPRASWITDMLEIATYDRIGLALRAAVADPDVKGVVLEIDSPGGVVAGVPELAREIRGARGRKPVVAVANAEAGSAAYWIASQADEVVVTPSGQVGSIGTVFVHTDLSGMAEQSGVRFTIVRAPERKFEGNPYESLSDEALADLQAKIDTYTAMFQRDVARGRGVTLDRVRRDFGQGRMLMAKDALAAGMVDRIATLEETVARVMGGHVPARGTAPEDDPAALDGAGAEPPAVAASTDSPIDLEERRWRAARLWEIARAGRG